MPDDRDPERGGLEHEYIVCAVPDHHRTLAPELVELAELVLARTCPDPGPVEHLRNRVERSERVSPHQVNVQRREQPRDSGRHPVQQGTATCERPVHVQHEMVEPKVPPPGIGIARVIGALAAIVLRAHFASIGPTVLALTLIGFAPGAVRSPLGWMTCFYGLRMSARGRDAQC